MPDSYYPEPTEDDSPKPESKGEEPDTETTLIPKTLLAGKEFKPGDEVIFKIVHMYDDEVEIAYATDEKKEEPKSAMDESMDDMGKMAMKEE